MSTTFSDPQRFLMAADLVAKGHNYFHWRVVADMLHWRDHRSQEALRSLGDEGFLLVHGSEETKLSVAGREAAEKLASHVRGGARALKALLVEPVEPSASQKYDLD